MRRGLAALVVLGAVAVGVRRRRAPDRDAAPSVAGLAALAATLTAASAPALARQAATERDRRLFWALLAAEQLRFGMALAHLEVLDRVYADGNDTQEYDAAGRAIAEHLRTRGIAGVSAVMRNVPWETRLAGPIGTNLMRLLSGAVYAIVGPDKRGGFLVFSWVGFWGLLWFYRAFTIAVPGGSAATYRRLLFLLPSLAFHTSSLGKEAWMVMSLGLGSLGVAHTLTGSPRRGIAQGLLGASLAALMRVQVGGRLGLTVGTELRDAGARSDFGGSAFSPPHVQTATDVPRVAGTVLFRPHLLEAHNAQARAAALEGAFLLALSAHRLRGLGAARTAVCRQPYVGFAAGATICLVAYLSRVANFGMLVRQRASLLPFYLVLLSIPPRG